MLATALGCATFASEEHFIDEGEACVSTDPNDGSYWIQVDAGICLTSCDEQVDSMCNVVLEGTMVIVTSDIAVRRKGEGPCTGDCMRASTSCRVPAISDGVYTLAFGDAFAGLTIPPEADPETCIGSE